MKNLLLETDKLYFSAIENWSQKRLRLPLNDLTRFDSIHLFGLGEFDRLLPKKTMKKLTDAFQYWQIDIDNIQGLHLELGKEEGKSTQAISFILEVPEEVYILMNPEGGWVDLETLGHELGHGLSAVFTSPNLSIVERDMPTSYSLSESFAFLIQNIPLSRPFLEEYLGIKQADSKEIVYHKTLKDLSVFRRYAAKFMAEVDMFSSGDIANGEHYAKQLVRFTGFKYQPESHLFDLTPEFYSLEYLLGWMAEAILEEHLRNNFGTDWAFQPETGRLLKKWWEQGNQYDIFEFFDRNCLGPLTPDQLLKRWNKILH